LKEDDKILEVITIISVKCFDILGTWKKNGYYGEVYEGKMWVKIVCFGDGVKKIFQYFTSKWFARFIFPRL
jgi:hypothetical protein